MGTGSFPGVKCGRGVLLTTYSLLVPQSWNSRAIPLPPPPLGHIGPVTGSLYFTIYIDLFNFQITVLILVINQLMHKILFYNKLIKFLYMFRALSAHHQEVKTVLYRIRYHHTCWWQGCAPDGHLQCVMIPGAV